MCDLKPFCTFYSKILQVKYKYNIPNIEKSNIFIKNGLFSTSKNAISKVTFSVEKNDLKAWSSVEN